MYLLIAFLVVLLYACDADCPQEPYNRIIISSNMKIDTIISPITIDLHCLDEKCRAEGSIRKLNVDTIPLTIVVNNEILVYSLGYEEMSHIKIVVDSTVVDCKSGGGYLSEYGYNHFRVDSKNAKSCVFYFEPSCP